MGSLRPACAPSSLCLWPGQGFGAAAESRTPRARVWVRGRAPASPPLQPHSRVTATNPQRPSVPPTSHGPPALVAWGLPVLHGMRPAKCHPSAHSAWGPGAVSQKCWGAQWTGHAHMPPQPSRWAVPAGAQGLVPNASWTRPGLWFLWPRGLHTGLSCSILTTCRSQVTRGRGDLAASTWWGCLAFLGVV